MKYRLIHSTQYKYRNTVNGYYGLACLEPLVSGNQLLHRFSLDINPVPDEFVKRTDFFGNVLHQFTINTPHKELVVRSESEVENIDYNTSAILNTISCENARNEIEQNRELRNELWPYIIESHFVKWDTAIKEYASASFLDQKPLFDAVADLCSRIFHDFEFSPQFSDVNTPLQVVLKEKKGVCQDFSHLALACMRSMGLPARYVSGYLETLPAPGKAKLQGSDASHAWISAYIPGIGWCEFDPTNNLIPGERHIRTAYGRDYNDVVPLRGVMFTNGAHKLKVEVDVLRID